MLALDSNFRAGTRCCSFTNFTRTFIAVIRRTIEGRSHERDGEPRNLSRVGWTREPARASRSTSAERSRSEPTHKGIIPEPRTRPYASHRAGWPPWQKLFAIDWGVTASMKHPPFVAPFHEIGNLRNWRQRIGPRDFRQQSRLPKTGATAYAPGHELW